MSPLVRSVQTVRRWLRHCWLSRLPLLGRLGAAPTQARKPQRPKAVLETDQLDKREVVDSPYGVTPAALLAGTAVAGFAAIVTPTEVMWSGWGVTGSPLAPQAQPQPLAEATADPLFCLQHDVCFADWNVLPDERPVAALPTQEDAEEAEPVQAVATAAADPSGSLNDPIFLDRIKAALAVLDDDNADTAEPPQGSDSGFSSLADEANSGGGGGGGGGASDSGSSSQGGGGGSGAAGAESLPPGLGVDQQPTPTDFVSPFVNSAGRFILPPDSTAGSSSARPRTTPDGVVPDAPGQEPSDATSQPTVPDETPPRDIPAIPPHLQSNFGRLPLAFEVNAGQSHSRNQFLARGAGYQIALTGNEADLVLSRSRPGQAARDENADAAVRDVVRVRFVGGRDDVELVGRDQLLTRSNYFRAGTDAVALSDLANYATVVAPDVWPGIDVVYKGDQHNLRFDFEVQPGADLSRIALAYPGLEGTHLDGQGRLVLRTPGGDVVQQNPVLFQDIGGVRHSVAGSYVARADGSVGFRVESFDAEHPLTIDPTLVFATYFGGSMSDFGNAVAVDHQGNVYVGGTTWSTDLPEGSYGSVQGGIEAFVAKFNARGDALLYVAYVGGAAVHEEGGQGVAVDAAGSAYLTGYAMTSDFPTTTGAYQTSLAGSHDAFLTKLSPAGNALVYSTLLGGTSADKGAAVAVDLAGQAYVVGQTASTDFDTQSADQGSAGGNTDTFVTAFSSDGTALLWSTYLGGTGLDEGYGIAVNASGQVAVAGFTQSSDFPTTGSAYDASLSGGSDAFVVRYTAAGVREVATYYGGSGDETGKAVAIDAAGQMVLVGSTGSSSGVATTGAYDETLGSTQDGFAVAFDDTGNARRWGSYFGGDYGTEEANGVVLDDAGNVYVAGWTTNDNWPGDPMDFQFDKDVFTLRLEADGASAGWLTFLSGSGEDVGNGIARDLDGNVVVVGSTTSTNLPTQSPFQGSNNGQTDVLLVRYDNLPAPVLTSISSDSGALSTDFITSDQTLSLSGTSLASATIHVYRPGLGEVGTTTANGSGAWTFNYTGTTLAEGVHAFTFAAEVSGETGRVSRPALVRVDLTAPVVTLTVDATTTDPTPEVRVVATDAGVIAEGATVTLDIDLNNDNDFLDAGETGHSTGTMYDGLAVFSVATALSVSTVRMQARVSDLAGNQGTSTASTVVIQTPPAWTLTDATALIDPLSGDALLQRGNLGLVHGLDLDLSPGTGVGLDVALVYHSERVSVQPVVQVQINTDNVQSLPSTITAQLTWNGGSPQASQNYSTTGLLAGQALLVGQQVSTAVTTTGRYTYALAITLNYGTPSTQTVTGSMFVVAEDASPYGAGWALNGVDKLVSIAASGGDPAGMLRVYGSGGHGFYTSAGGGAYTSPAGDPGTLTSSTGGGLTTYTYASPDGRAWTFNDSGEQVKATSADTFAALTYTYASGAVSKIETPDGGISTLTYASSLLSKIETGSRVVTATMSSGDLTKITNPDGGVHTLIYDGSTHRLTRDDFAGLRGTYTYNSGSLARFTKGDEGSTVVNPVVRAGLSALALGGLKATTTDPRGSYTTTKLDRSGRPLQQVAPDGGVTAWTRDGNGWVTGIDDPLGRHTTIARDAAGYATTITLADGSTTNRQYQTNFHALTQYTDERGNRTTFTYDNYGHPTSVKDALGRLTTLTYNATSGLLETVKDALGRVTTTLYDSARRLQTQINAAGDRATWTYDSNGNVETTKDELGRVTTFVNDALGRVTKVTDALGGVTTNVYDGAGLLSYTINALGQRNNFEYNRTGRETRRVEAVGTAEQRSFLRGYDAASNARTSRDANGYTTTSTFDAVNRSTAQTDPIGATRSRILNAAGEATRELDELGRVATTVYDSMGRVTKTVDALGNTTTTVYDAAGNVTGRIDARGNRTSFVYDALNREVSRTEAVGTSLARTLTTVYDEVGNVVQRIDALGRVTSMAFDSLNRLTTLTQAVGTGVQRSMTYAYDKVGNQTGSTDWRGYRSEATYDSLNRRTVAKEAVGQSEERSMTWTYDAIGNVTSLKDPLGRTTSTVYDSLNQESKRTEALGTGAARKTTVMYDANGNAVKRFDPLGKVWTNSVDERNLPNVRIDPENNQSRNFYEATRAPLQDQDARGNRILYRNDALNRTERTTDALGNVSSTVYDPIGNVSVSIDARGYRTTFTYDELNRQVEVKDALGYVTTTVYDANDNVVKRIDALGKAFTIVYDELNRQVSVQNPTGGIATTVYDANSNVTVGIDPLGHRLTHTYDALNRETKRTDALTGVTTLLYDAVGNQTGLIDPVGNRTTFVYDELNRLVKEIDPLGKTLTWTYDARDKLTETVDRLGRKRQFDYNARGLLRSETWRDSSNNVVSRLTWSYDANSNPLTAQNGQGTYTFTYDNADRVSKVKGLFGTTFTHTYDAVGNRTKVEDNFGGVLTTVYDGLNRVTTQLFGGVSQTPLRWDTTYTPRGQTDTVNRYSDLAGTTKIGETNFTYDNPGRVENLKHKNGAGTTLANYTHTYDAASRITSEVLNGTATNYGYDDTDQLTSAGTFSYDYDLNGNRDSAGYTTGTGNRTTNDGLFTYTYDDESNLIKKSKGASAETWTFTYDNRNQLVGVTQRSTDGGGTLLFQGTYTYDVFSNRVKAEEYVNGSGTTTTKSAFDDDGNVFADLTSANAMQTRYLRQDGAQYSPVVARIDGGGTAAWLYADRLGSTRNVVNGSGTLIATVAYDGFGGILSESSPANTGDITFTGLRYLRNAGLLQAHYRVYDPLTGKWISQDPIRWDGGDLSLVRYAGNDPLNATDRSGLQRLKLVAKRLRKTGKIEDLDGEIDGATPYRDLTSAAITTLNNQNAALFGEYNLTLQPPTHLGNMVVASPAGGGRPAGALRWASKLVFFEWDIKFPTGVEKIFVFETFSDTRGQPPPPIEDIIPANLGSARVVKLKNARNGATHRVLLVDTPGSTVTPNGTFRYEVDGVRYLISRGVELDGSQLRMDFLLKVKRGVITMTIPD